MKLGMQHRSACQLSFLNRGDLNSASAVPHSGYTVDRLTQAYPIHRSGIILNAGTPCQFRPWTYIYIGPWFRLCQPVWFGGKALGCKQKDLGSIPLRFSSVFRSCSLWTVFVTLPLTVIETLTWLSSLPTLMQKSFW